MIRRLSHCRKEPRCRRGPRLHRVSDSFACYWVDDPGSVAAEENIASSRRPSEIPKGNILAFYPVVGDREILV